MSESSRVRQVTRRELLDIREKQWAPRLRPVSLAAEAEISEAHRTQVVSALGCLYGNGRFRGANGIAFLSLWPACLVASMTGVAVTSYAQGTYWEAAYAGTPTTSVRGTAFADALAELGARCSRACSGRPARSEISKIFCDPYSPPSSGTGGAFLSRGTDDID